MDCKNCNKPCIKWGRQKSGCQRWYCKGCKGTQQAVYKNNGCNNGIDRQISVLVCESVGIRSIGRILKIATGTVLRKILQAAAAITKPPVPLNRAAFDTAWLIKIGHSFLSSGITNSNIQSRPMAYF
jgi:transposase-like protein